MSSEATAFSRCAARGAKRCARGPWCWLLLVLLGLAMQPATGLGVVRPDFDGDGDVDQEDFGHFQTCLTGEGNPQRNTDCHDARFDNDDDVDQDDFAVFQICFDPTTVPDVSEFCPCFDWDDDGNVDGGDFVEFQACASGPGIVVDPQNPPMGCTP